MTRLAVLFVAIILLAVGAAWLADRPGEIVLTWQGYHIETSLMAAGLMLLISFAVLMFSWTLLRLALHTPGAVSGFLRGRRKAKGYHALSRGMIAIGAGDARAAGKFADQARKILPDEPLTLLLRAQSAQMRGDRDTARRAFQAMLSSSETATLGRRGLYIEAQRAGDATAMRSHAEAALAANPAAPWAASALFDMQCAARDWAGALKTLRSNTAAKLADKAAARRQRAVLLTAQALEAERDSPQAALDLAIEAHAQAPDLVPAAALAGRLLATQGNVRRAARILEKAWRLSPHPEIAEIYANVRSGDSTRDRLKRMRVLAAKAPEAREGAIALAAAAIDARDWTQARQALEPYLRSGLSQRVCSLMAEIEDGEHGDRGRVREWLTRAVRAPRDPAWTADGTVSETWQPVSPVTGRLDAYEWRVPVEALAPPPAGTEAVSQVLSVDGGAPAIVEPAAALPAGGAAAPRAQPGAETPPGPPIEAARTPAAQGGSAHVKRPEPAALEPEVMATQKAPGPSADAERLEADDLVPLPPRAPDDPGPVPDPIDDEDARLRAPE